MLCCLLRRSFFRVGGTASQQQDGPAVPGRPVREAEKAVVTPCGGAKEERLILCPKREAVRRFSSSADFDEAKDVPVHGPFVLQANHQPPLSVFLFGLAVGLPKLGRAARLSDAGAEFYLFGAAIPILQLCAELEEHRVTDLFPQFLLGWGRKICPPYRLYSPSFRLKAFEIKIF